MNQGRFSLSFVCVFAVMFSMVDVTSAGQCYYDTNRPVFGVPISVTLRVNNQLRAPFFQANTTLSQWPQTWLVNLLNAANDDSDVFNYKASYSGKLGYYINTIYSLTENTADGTYWSIVDDRTGINLQCGVSSFVPDDNDVILFNFTNAASSPPVGPGIADHGNSKREL